MQLKVFVIGYKNHASRVVRQLIKTRLCCDIFVFHPDKHKLNNIEILDDLVVKTDSLRDAFSCSCIFICSPSNTHVPYLKKFLDLQPTNGPIPYIYCEKPVATSSDEIRWLEANISFFSKKLKIGFNLLYSDFVIETSRLIQNKSIGKPLSIFFQTSHGLAGKNNFGSNWRAHDPNPFSQLIGNLAIHHVHVCHYLFGEVDKFLLTESNAFNARNPDTISLLLHHESGVQSHIFCSYATICFKRFSVYFTDGLLEHSDEGLVMRSPRNFSNSAGEFATPPKNVVSEHSVYSDATLYQSITNFLEKVMTGEGLGEGNVRSAIAASKIVLEIISKTRHPSRRNPLINPD